MNALSKIIGIALISFLVGAAALFGCIGGLLGVVFSPLLSVLGWFYFPIALLATSVMWTIYRPISTSPARRTGFIAVAGIFGAGLMQLIGVRESSGGIPWTTGFLLGGGLGGIVAAYLITRWRK